MSHTPGPWTCNRPACHDAIDIRQDLPCPGGFDRLIAHVFEQRGEEHANARLIAAAPELLALVAEIGKRPCLRTDWEHCSISMEPEPPCQTCRARALLARIDGR